jgi:hypothetical protein
MRTSTGYFIASTLLLTTAICSAIHPDWSDFGPITLTAIDAQNQVRQGSATVTLYVETVSLLQFSADNTPASQLTLASSGDTLITEYDVTTDGDGVSDTGATAAAIAASGTGTGINRVWTAYNNFLAVPLEITRASGDEYVDVTLYIRVYNRDNNVSDRGDYTATQTFTLTW